MLTLSKVLITLTSVEHANNFPFPVRQIFLSEEDLTVRIGRASRRDSAFHAKDNNGFFDSPVMSRDHAKIEINPYSQV